MLLGINFYTFVFLGSREDNFVGGFEGSEAAS